MKRHRTLPLLAAGLLLAGCAADANARPADRPEPPTPSATPRATTARAPTARAAGPRPATAGLRAHSLTDPRSIWVVVNKRRPLHPLTYRPPDLASVGHGQFMREPAARELIAMLAAAARAGLSMQADSGWRTYAYQVAVHRQAVASEGERLADESSARPGYSEHQTGWAVDLAGDGCDIAACFAATPDGRWVAANAYRWGFIIRYPAGEEAITGYEPEPWHVRYVGIPLATRMRNGHIPTLEQAFGLPSAPDYPH